MKKIVTWPENFVFGQVLFSLACMCLCVCLWTVTSIISNSSWPILMKLGRMIYNDQRQVPFEDEHYRFIRTEVTKNPTFYFFLLRPFDNIFLMLLPLFYYWRGEMQLDYQKHPRLWKTGRARYVFYWTHQILVFLLWWWQ